MQWLSDNGSIFAAHKTIEIALALNLALCFPVESPESNGMAETFVKTFKRDYIRISPIPDAAALAAIDHWMEDYNTVHPHSRLGYRSPREYILSQPAVCPVERRQLQSGRQSGRATIFARPCRKRHSRRYGKQWIETLKAAIEVIPNPPHVAESGPNGYAQGRSWPDI